MGDLLDLRLARDARPAGAAQRLERGARRRELVRVLQGAYALPEDWEEASARTRHAAMISVLRGRSASEPVFVAESAAILHELPLIGYMPEDVRVAVPRGKGHDAYGVRRRHRVHDPRDLVTLPSGARATSRVRTAVDLAATRSSLGGLIAMAALLGDGVREDEIEECLARAGAMRGIRAARWAFAHAPRGSESPLETLVMVRCADLGFAEPEQQRLVRGVDGIEYRVDFAWRDGAILGEADGKLKYAGGRDRPTPADVLWAEKRREDALRARCAAFVRVGWEDAWDGIGLNVRLISARVPRVRMPRPLTW